MIKFNLEENFKFNKLLKKFHNHLYFLILLFILFFNYLGFKFESSNTINTYFLLKINSAIKLCLC